MFSFFRDILATTHLISDLSSFLDLFQPFFLLSPSVGITWRLMRQTFSQVRILCGLFIPCDSWPSFFSCPTPFSGVVSCSGFSLVTLIKIIVLAFEKSNIFRDLLWLLLLFILLLYSNGIGGGLCVLACVQEAWKVRGHSCSYHSHMCHGF